MYSLAYHYRMAFRVSFLNLESDRASVTALLRHPAGAPTTHNQAKHRFRKIHTIPILAKWIQISSELRTRKRGRAYARRRWALPAICAWGADEPIHSGPSRHQSPTRAEPGPHRAASKHRFIYHTSFLMAQGRCCDPTGGVVGPVALDPG